MAIVAAMPDYPRVGVPDMNVMRRAVHGMAGMGVYYDETGAVVDDTGGFMQDTQPQNIDPETGLPAVFTNSSGSMEILDWDPSLDTLPGKVSGSLPKTAQSSNWITQTLQPLLKAGAQVWVNQNPPGGGQGYYSIKGPSGETVYVQPAGQKANILTAVSGTAGVGVTTSAGTLEIAAIGGVALLVLLLVMRNK